MRPRRRTATWVATAAMMIATGLVFVPGVRAATVPDGSSVLVVCTAPAWAEGNTYALGARVTRSAVAHRAGLRVQRSRLREGGSLRGHGAQSEARDGLVPRGAARLRDDGGIRLGLHRGLHAVERGGQRVGAGAPAWEHGERERAHVGDEPELLVVLGGVEHRAVPDRARVVAADVVEHRDQALGVAAATFAMFLGKLPVGTATAYGACAGLCWVAASFGINYLFENKPFGLFLVNGGYHALQFTLFGFILGLWH